jgi:hypothetical protein
MNHGSTASARRAVSALFVGNGFAFGVWSAHIAVFKQNYGLSNAQLTIPLFTLALGPIISMPVAGDGGLFHRRLSQRSMRGNELAAAFGLAGCLWLWIRASGNDVCGSDDWFADCGFRHFQHGCSYFRRGGAEKFGKRRGGDRGSL